jgi:hypothetical protein
MGNEKGDFTEKRASFSVRNLFLGGVALLGVGGGGSMAWSDLKSGQQANRNEIKLMQCDIRELKNFMIYGEKPKTEKECK